MSSAPPVLEIIWHDTGLHADRGWGTAEQFEDQSAGTSKNVHTVGYWMYETEDEIAVGQSYDPPNEQFLAAQIISKSAIQSKSIIGVKE